MDVGQFAIFLSDMYKRNQEQSSLEDMLKPDCHYTVTINKLLEKIRVVQDDTDRRLHYRRQLEHMLKRLQKNQLAFDCHLGHMADARDAALREHADMEAMTRQIEAGHTAVTLELAEAQRLKDVEQGEMDRALAQREAEAEQSARMEAWQKQRKLERQQFQAEMRGDLSENEEKLLQAKLRERKATLSDVRAEHETLQREANQLEGAFAAVRQATGVNSLDEVVEKFQSQQSNRKSLMAEKRDAEERLLQAKRSKERLEARFAELRASGIGSTEMNRDIAEQLEGEIAGARAELKASNAGCERLEAVLVALRQGAVGLYQRLRPFGHLLEGEGSLPTAAMLPGATMTQSGPPDVQSVDSADALHLSEIMLSKMVEILGGGDHGGARSPVAQIEDEPGASAVDERGSLTGENNVRVRSDATSRDLDRQGATFLTAGDAMMDEADDGGEGAAGMDVGLTDAQIAGALDDLVPSRRFLKLSSTRQHQEALRRIDADDRQKRIMELAESSATQKKAQGVARKKAQDAALARLSQALNNGQPKPLSRTKDSAIERSLDMINTMPEMA